MKLKQIIATGLSLTVYQFKITLLFILKFQDDKNLLEFLVYHENCNFLLK